MASDSAVQNQNNGGEQAMWIKAAIVSGALLSSFACAALAQEATPAAPAAPAVTAVTPEARVAALKESFVASKAALKQYGWIETTALSLGGEEKVRQQYQCYYGAEGALQKVPIAADAKEEKKRGLRGKAIEAKKEELSASLKSAVALLHEYAPLDPAKIQAAKDAGNLSVSIPTPEGTMKVIIKNYLKAGDEVAIDVDSAKNTVKALAISSYVGDAAAKDKSPVTAKVTYNALPDGTLYPAKETLDISAQGLKVDVQTSGYKKQG